MFVITEADAAAIRAVFEQEGELSAAIEVRRRFPGITDNAKARCYATSRLDTRQALRSRSGYASPRSDGYCQRAQFGQAQAAVAEAFGLA
jgi:hypothetical protein